MDTDESAAHLHVMLQRVLLPIVEQIAGRIEKDNSLVLGEILVGECRGILTCINRKLIVPAQLLYRRDAIRN